MYRMLELLFVPIWLLPFSSLFCLQDEYIWLSSFDCLWVYKLPHLFVCWVRLPSLQPVPSFWLALASSNFFFFAKRFQVSCYLLVRSSPASYLNSSHPPECYRELLAALMDSSLLKFPLWISQARFDLVAWKWCLWMFSYWISPSPQVPPCLPLSSQDPKCPSEDLTYPFMEASNGEVIEGIIGIGRWLIPILLNFFSLCLME